MKFKKSIYVIQRQLWMKPNVEYQWNHHQSENFTIWHDYVRKKSSIILIIYSSVGIPFARTKGRIPIVSARSFSDIGQPGARRPIKIVTKAKIQHPKVRASHWCNRKGILMVHTISRRSANNDGGCTRIQFTNAHLLLHCLPATFTTILKVGRSIKMDRFMQSCCNNYLITRIFTAGMWRKCMCTSQETDR